MIPRNKSTSRKYPEHTVKDKRVWLGTVVGGERGELCSVSRPLAPRCSRQLPVRVLGRLLPYAKWGSALQLLAHWDQSGGESDGARFEFRPFVFRRNCFISIKQHDLKIIKIKLLLKRKHLLWCRCTEKKLLRQWTHQGKRGGGLVV